MPGQFWWPLGWQHGWEQSCHLDKASVSKRQENTSEILISTWFGGHTLFLWLACFDVCLCFTCLFIYCEWGLRYCRNETFAKNYFPQRLKQEKISQTILSFFSVHPQHGILQDLRLSPLETIHQVTETLLTEVEATLAEHHFCAKDWHISSRLFLHHENIDCFCSSDLITGS